MKPEAASLPSERVAELSAAQDAGASGSLGIPARLRLSLQHQAPLSLRRHVLRGLVRFVALVTFDLAAFGVLRELVRSVRDHAVLGGGVAGFVQRHFEPRSEPRHARPRTQLVSA